MVCFEKQLSLPSRAVFFHIHHWSSPSLGKQSKRYGPVDRLDHEIYESESTSNQSLDAVMTPALAVVVVVFACVSVYEQTA